MICHVCGCPVVSTPWRERQLRTGGRICCGRKCISQLCVGQHRSYETRALMSLMRSKSLEWHIQRFWQNVIITASGCHEWQGGRVPDGYGNLWDKERLVLHTKERRAHRIAWVLKAGPVPTGKLVLHSCDNPPCINWDHLHLGDPLMNMQEKVERGRWKGGRPKLRITDEESV